MLPSRTPRHRAAADRRPPRAVVGAAAATVLCVLMVGGHGSFASWTSSAEVPATSVRSGSLALIPQTPTGGSQGCTPWALTQTGGTASGVPDSSVVPPYLQPHDVLTQTCTYLLSATGTHLKGTITVDTGAGYRAPPAGVSLGTASITLGTTSGAVGGTGGSVGFTATDGGSVLTVVFRLSVADAPTSQSSPVPAYGGTFSTAGLSLTATQVHA